MAVSIVAMLVPWMTVPLILFGAIAIATFVLAWRAKRRALLTASALAGLLAVLMIAVPFAAASATADDYGAELSWGEYFAAPDTVTPDRTETYAVIDDEELNVDVYLPEQSTVTVPAIMYVHGGGWSGGTRDWESAAAQQWLADQGFRGLLDRLPPRFPAALAGRRRRRQVRPRLGQDQCRRLPCRPVQCLHRRRLGGRPARHDDRLYRRRRAVPALLQNRGSAGVLRDELVRPGRPHHPGADSDMPASAEGYLVDYLGGTLEAETERYEAASPLNHVAQGLPPTMIVQGEADRLVGRRRRALHWRTRCRPQASRSLSWTCRGRTTGSPANGEVGVRRCCDRRSRPSWTSTSSADRARAVRSPNRGPDRLRICCSYPDQRDGLRLRRRHHVPTPRSPPRDRRPPYGHSRCPACAEPADLKDPLPPGPVS